MSYDYYNQFNLSNELAQSISTIISEKEGTDYICTSLVVTIPEHNKSVFQEPYKYVTYSHDPIHPGRAKIDVKTEPSRYVEKKFRAEEYSYLVVMDMQSFKAFSKLKFKSENEIQRALNKLSIFNIEYDGIFDSRWLIKKFSYLEKFFDNLDNWRAEAGKVTLDDDILSECMMHDYNVSKKQKVKHI